MKPFEDYPEGGYTVLPKGWGTTARREYGHWLVERGQTSCAYCEMSLVDSYEHWLMPTAEHVIPVADRDRLRIPTNWHESYSNIILACSGCNGFRNRYEVTCLEPRESLRESDFFKLRGKGVPGEKGSEREGAK